MSNSDFEQISDAQKASAEVLMSIMRTSFEGMQRLAALNMAAAKDAVSSTVANTSKLASSKDITDMARINQQIAEPQRMMEYWRNVYDLVSAMQKDVTAVMQGNYNQLAKSAASAIGQKKTPGMDGGEMIAGVMKNMLEQTNKVFDNMSSVTDQMSSLAHANIQAATPDKTKTTGSDKKPAGKK